MSNRPHQDILDAAYVIKGFFYTVDHRKLDLAPLCRNDGELGMVQHVIDLANLCDEFWETNQDTGKVWPYEICEPFGEWLAHQATERGGFPSLAECREKIQQLIKE